jgi:hypothetical protein
MTEAEWLAGDDPQKLIEFLCELPATDRKLRLFGVACCRQVWNLLTEDCFRAAVELAERFADGKASKKELADAKKASGAALERNGLAGVIGPKYCALGSAWSTTRNPPTAAIYPLWVFTEQSQREWELLLARDIFGNPFRSLAVDPGWLTPTVVQFAQSIYDTRAIERLPILADALEEAGCTDAAILAHCRQPGEHVRGCWVVDLILGKY